MIDIDMSKYTQLCARDAVQLMGSSILPGAPGLIW